MNVRRNSTQYFYSLREVRFYINVTGIIVLDPGDQLFLNYFWYRGEEIFVGNTGVNLFYVQVYFNWQGYTTDIFAVKFAVLLLIFYEHFFNTN